MAWHRVSSSPDAADLDEVLITNELSRRPARSPDYEAENRALVGLARAMVDSPQSILPRLVETALDLCNAQTAGISLLESSDAGEEIFRWHALAGAYAANLGGTTPPRLQPLRHRPRPPHPATVLEPGTALRLSRRGVPFNRRMLTNTIFRGRQAGGDGLGHDR